MLIALAGMWDEMRLTNENGMDGQRLIRRLRWLGVVLPATSLLLLLFVTVEVLTRELSSLAAVFIAFGLGFVGIILFSRAVFLAIERMQQRITEQNRDLKQRTAQLQAVHEASLQISANLDLKSVLQTVVDSSRDLIQTRYAALSVVNDGLIEQFITSGLSEEERQAIGELPRGRGLLGHVLKSGKAYRSGDIPHDPHSVGFPANHPQMTTFLGIPIVSGGRTLGDLYLTDKEAGTFTGEDENILNTLAVQAAIAIENARLYESLEEMTVLKERERISIDLHDGAVQSLYGVGLKLESCVEELRGESTDVSRHLESVVQELNRVVRRIRGYIFDLQPDELEGKDLAGCLEDLLRELSVNSVVRTELVASSEGGQNPCRFLSSEQTDQLFQIAREAITNIFKHAQASNVQAEVSAQDGKFRLRIIDDGVGIPRAPQSLDGQGLPDMRQRAAALGGNLTVETRDCGGTIVTVTVPIG